MVTIFLKAVRKDSGDGIEECLEMYDSNCSDKMINNLETKVLAGTKIKWKLAKDSNIKSLISVHANTGSTNVFREKPKKVPGAEEFEVYTKKTELELLGKYDITYIPNNSTTQITIDPYIRVKLSQ